MLKSLIIIAVLVSASTVLAQNTAGIVYDNETKAVKRIVIPDRDEELRGLSVVQEGESLLIHQPYDRAHPLDVFSAQQLVNIAVARQKARAPK